jgi:predicted transcriptional regulator
MRTTITLDPDIAAKLRSLARERGTTFKAVVNSVLRRGLSEEEVSARPFRVDTRSLGLRPGVDLVKALALAAELEDEETLRKLELRK